ncbi:MAG: ribosome biogenesis GTPase YlqF [Eubacterium sp.]|nr:ribosome biogenesis GTPase YlqF [Eubacterium sp.]
MDINWYPGHMTGARRKMQEDIKLCDIVIELLDARIPGSSKNPDLDDLIGNKKRLIILNKADMADSAVTEKWVNYYESKGIKVLTMDSRIRKQTLKVTAAVKEVCKEKIERDRRRGIAARPIKAMVAGIPNVGKSTFINSFVGKTSAKTGNKPGVTRGNQWIRISKDINLLDTPGILWPKFDNQQIGLNLSFIGSINDNILEMTDVAGEFISFLKDNYCNILAERYMIKNVDDVFQIMEEIAIAKKCIKKGGEPDIEKACILLLDDFRSGKLGRISLETPQED